MSATTTAARPHGIHRTIGPTGSDHATTAKTNAKMARTEKTRPAWAPSSWLSGCTNTRHHGTPAPVAACATTKQAGADKDS